MKIMSSIAALVTATSIGIATECAWSDETTPGGSAVPAVQTPVPATNPAAGYYPPPSRRGGYEQRWRQPSQWPAPPAGYGQVRPYYPPQRQYQAAPAAPAKNPVSAESKQTQEQLTAKSTELDTAHATIEQLQLQLQHSLEAERALNEKVAAITGEQQALQAQVTELLAAPQAVQQAPSETTTSGQQPGVAGTEVAMLNGVLTELKIQLQNQNIRLQDAEQTLAACRLELTRAK